MFERNVRLRRTFFARASLLIANERLIPYQVYSFEPGFDRESKSRIKKGGQFLTKTPVLATRPSDNVQLTPSQTPLMQNFRWLQVANQRLTPYQVYSFEPGFDRESKSRIKKGGSIFDQSTRLGHPSQLKQSPLKGH